MEGKETKIIKVIENGSKVSVFSFPPRHSTDEKKINANFREKVEAPFGNVPPKKKHNKSVLVTHTRKRKGLQQAWLLCGLKCHCGSFGTVASTVYGLYAYRLPSSVRCSTDSSGADRSTSSAAAVLMCGVETGVGRRFGKLGPGTFG